MRFVSGCAWQLHFYSGIAKGKPKFSTDLVVLGIRFKHVAGQRELIVVNKILVGVDSLVAQGIIWQCASRPCKVSLYQCPELGKIHANGTIQRPTSYRN
jgi:hypothetical protein